MGVRHSSYFIPNLFHSMESNIYELFNSGTSKDELVKEKKSECAVKVKDSPISQYDKDNAVENRAKPISDENSSLLIREQTASSVLTPSRYNAIAELDFEHHNEFDDWSDRTSIITKWDHMEYNNYALSCIDEIINDVVRLGSSTSWLSLPIYDSIRGHDDESTSDDDSFVSTLSLLPPIHGAATNISDDSCAEYESANEDTFDEYLTLKNIVGDDDDTRLLQNAFEMLNVATEFDKESTPINIEENISPRDVETTTLVRFGSSSSVNTLINDCIDPLKSVESGGFMETLDNNGPPTVGDFKEYRFNNVLHSSSGSSWGGNEIMSTNLFDMADTTLDRPTSMSNIDEDDIIVPFDKMKVSEIDTINDNITYLEQVVETNNVFFDDNPNVEKFEKNIKTKIFNSIPIEVSSSKIKDETGEESSQYSNELLECDDYGKLPRICRENILEHKCQSGFDSDVTQGKKKDQSGFESVNKNLTYGSLCQDMKVVGRASLLNESFSYCEVKTEASLLIPGGPVQLEVVEKQKDDELTDLNSDVYDFNDGLCQQQISTIGYVNNIPLLDLLKQPSINDDNLLDLTASTTVKSIDCQSEVFAKDLSLDIRRSVAVTKDILVDSFKTKNQVALELNQTEVELVLQNGEQDILNENVSKGTEVISCGVDLEKIVKVGEIEMNASIYANTTMSDLAKDDLSIQLMSCYPESKSNICSSFSVNNSQVLDKFKRDDNVDSIANVVENNLDFLVDTSVNRFEATSEVILESDQDEIEVVGLQDGNQNITCQDDVTKSFEIFSCDEKIEKIVKMNETDLLKLNDNVDDTTAILAAKKNNFDLLDFSNYNRFEAKSEIILESDPDEIEVVELQDVDQNITCQGNLAKDSEMVSCYDEMERIVKVNKTELLKLNDNVDDSTTIVAAKKNDLDFLDDPNLKHSEAKSEVIIESNQDEIEIELQGDEQNISDLGNMAKDTEVVSCGDEMEKSVKIKANEIHAFSYADSDSMSSLAKNELNIQLISNNPEPKSNMVVKHCSSFSVNSRQSINDLPIDIEDNITTMSLAKGCYFDFLDDTNFNPSETKAKTFQVTALTKESSCDKYTVEKEAKLISLSFNEFDAFDEKSSPNFDVPTYVNSNMMTENANVLVSNTASDNNRTVNVQYNSKELSSKYSYSLNFSKLEQESLSNEVSLLTDRSSIDDGLNVLQTSEEVKSTSNYTNNIISSNNETVELKDNDEFTVGPSECVNSNVDNCDFFSSSPGRQVMPHSVEFNMETKEKANSERCVGETDDVIVKCHRGNNHDSLVNHYFIPFENKKITHVNNESTSHDICFITLKSEENPTLCEVNAGTEISLVPKKPEVEFKIPLIKEKHIEILATPFSHQGQNKREEYRLIQECAEISNIKVLNNTYDGDTGDFEVKSKEVEFENIERNLMVTADDLQNNLSNNINQTQESVENSDPVFNTTFPIFNNANRTITLDPNSSQSDESNQQTSPSVNEMISSLSNVEVTGSMVCNIGVLDSGMSSVARTELYYQQLMVDKDRQISEMEKRVRQKEAQIVEINEQDALSELNIKKLIDSIMEKESIISAKITENEREKETHLHLKEQLMRENEETLEEVESAKKAFNDCNRKYEKTKEIISGLQDKEKNLKSIDREERTKLRQNLANYKEKGLKIKDTLARELHKNETLKKNKAAELNQLDAILKKRLLHLSTLERTFEEKERQNKELICICDDLIHKIGSAKA